MATATTTARLSLVDFLAPRETDSAARRHLIAAVIFLLVAGFFTMLLFVKLAYPNFLGGQAFTTYGRLRPIAVSATVLGFVTLMHLAAIYYLVPRLTGARLWNERLANLGLWLAVGVNVAAIVALAAGYSDGREWLEIPWWLDVAVVAMLLVPGTSWPASSGWSGSMWSATSRICTGRLHRSSRRSSCRESPSCG